MSPAKWVWEYISDFTWWETVAKLAPIATALIALVAAIIALGAIWVQMHIARRRASIDFFLKTEMDKTVIDLYDKFKANAPLIAFVPDPSDLTRSDYDNIRAFLNLCELIAVGVNKGAFSKSVSEAYWGDVIPDVYLVTHTLIWRSWPTDGLRRPGRQPSWLIEADDMPLCWLCSPGRSAPKSVVMQLLSIQGCCFVPTWRRNAA
jgi:hypothetical protein